MSLTIDASGVDAANELLLYLTKPVKVSWVHRGASADKGVEKEYW